MSLEDRSRSTAKAIAWVQGLPGSPWLPGLGVTALMLGLELLATWATPTEGKVEFNWFRALSLPVLSGYGFASITAVVTAAEHALRGLSASLPGGEAEAVEEAARIAAPSRVRLRRALLVGLLVPLGLGLTLSEQAAGVLAGNPIDLYFALAAITFWGLFALVVVFVAETGEVFGRLARERVQVDLFHMEPLRSFGAFALRQSLILVGAIALALLLLATPDAMEAWLLRVKLLQDVPLIAPAFVVTCGLAAAAFIQPMWAIHLRIQAEKQAAMDRIRGGLKPHWEETAAFEANPDSLRLSSLLSTLSQIGGLSEWPLEDWMKRRFGFYLLIPLVSLTIKALLEQIIQSAVP